MTKVQSTSKKSSRLVLVTNEEKKEFKVLMENHPEAQAEITKSRKTLENHAKFPKRGNCIYLYKNMTHAQGLYDMVDEKFEFERYE